MERNQKDSKGLKFGDNKNIIDHNIHEGVDYASEIIISSADTSDLEGLAQHNVLIELDHMTVEDFYCNQTDNAENVSNEVAAADENNNEDEVAEMDETDLSKNTTNSDGMGDTNGNNNIDELAAVENRADKMNY